MLNEAVSGHHLCKSLYGPPRVRDPSCNAITHAKQTRQNRIVGPNVTLRLLLTPSAM